ncbi:MAG: hypothetical protein JXA50_01780 [Deltaproteobacteria bacterium]|nr:hypothetical protein [Deltaproteobacteria bacterium]
MIDVQLHGDKELIIRLNKMDDQTLRAAEGVVTRSSGELVDYVKTRHLTGGTSGTRLVVRTGHLRRTTHEKPTRREGASVKGGIKFDAKYAPVHVGPRGQKTVIRPKRGKYLTFPVERSGAAGKPTRWVSVKQVTVPARVHPEDIRQWLLPRLKHNLKTALGEAL